MGRPPRNPDNTSPGDWTPAETAQIRLYGAHLSWLQERLWALSARVNDPTAFTGAINVPELRDVLRRFGELNHAFDSIREIFAMLALKRGQLTQRDTALLLGLSVTPINRWSQAFRDPDDFEPSRLTASLRLDDRELAQLVARWYTWDVEDGHNVDPQTGSVVLGQDDFILIPAGDPSDRRSRGLGGTTAVARQMRSLGWIYQLDETTSSVRWQALPLEGAEAAALIEEGLSTKGVS